MRRKRRPLLCQRGRAKLNARVMAVIKKAGARRYRCVCHTERERWGMSDRKGMLWIHHPHISFLGT